MMWSCLWQAAVSYTHLDIAADETFKKHLHAQLKEYRSIHDKAAQMLETNGFNEEGLSAFENLSSGRFVSFQRQTALPH